MLYEVITDEGGAEHLLGEFRRFLRRFCEADTAALACRGFLELALASAARMDLGLHHIERAWKLRITSYNVCYTKLLRAGRKADLVVDDEMDSAADAVSLQLRKRNNFV